MQGWWQLYHRCLIVLYFIGADKEVLQSEIVAAGAVPPVVKLCSSSDAALQAEAADLLKVSSLVIDVHTGDAFGVVCVTCHSVLSIDTVSSKTYSPTRLPN